MCLVVLTGQVLRTARVEEGAACSPLIGPTSLSLNTLSLSIGSSISLGAYPQPSASTSAPTSASAWISPAFKRATCLFFGASVLASEAASASGRSPQPSASTSAINLSVPVYLPPKQRLPPVLPPVQCIPQLIAWDAVHVCGRRPFLLRV
jgi:hypothetical protein